MDGSCGALKILFVTVPASPTAPTNSHYNKISLIPVGLGKNKRKKKFGLNKLIQTHCISVKEFINM